MLTFVPLSPAGLAEWASAGRRDVVGFAATRAFLETFELGTAESEDADLTLLELAGLAGLVDHGVRLVAVCATDARGVEPAEFGAVHAEGVRWSAVESLFADDQAGAAVASSVRDKLGDTTLEEAWEDDDVDLLLRTTELLWHGAGEWERLSH